MALKIPKIFYGYWILIAAFLCIFFMSGIGFYSFSLFVKPLAGHFDWSRGSIMTAITIFYIVWAIASPFAGRIFDRLGAPKMVALGTVVTVLGFILLSTMQTIGIFYLAWKLIGVGLSGFGQIPATAVVSNWFKKRRGLAIGIMTSGIGVGGFVFASLFGGYIIPTFGWRNGYLAIAILISAVLIPVALFVIKTRPEDKDLLPYGVLTDDSSGSTQIPDTSGSGMMPKEALKSLTFWLIAISFFFHTFSMSGIFLNQVPYMQDIQFPDAIAASVLGIVGIGSTIGKFGFGWLCDHIQAKYAVAIGITLQIIGLVLLMNISPTSAWFYAVIMGAGIGVNWPTMSILSSGHFGMKHYGTIFGIVNVAYLLGSGLGPLVAGYLHDAFDGYRMAFIIFLACFVIALVFIMLTRPIKSDKITPR